jgi:energy-coupling factor transporter ATP-binding protein EcfA2
VGRKTGHVFSQPDLLIAATAIQHDLTAVLRHRRSPRAEVADRRAHAGSLQLQRINYLRLRTRRRISTCYGATWSRMEDGIAGYSDST